MKTQARILTLIAVIATALVSPPPATAHQEDLLALDVLIDGRPLREIHARNATYIEAVRHAEYSLRLRNRTGSRIAVALAVDGLNTIDAKATPARRASKWVLDPWETVVIDGWQVGPDTARRFFFTTEDKSYGAWLGKTANLGIIEAVAFREYVPPTPEPAPILRDGCKSGARERSAESAAPPASGKPAPTDDLAATGIGRRIDNRVTRVRMQLEHDPAAHLRLRYEYREQLVSLGVLPSVEEERALARRERASGFEDFEFAPDPWGGK
jgi:hypothetical protein